MNLFWSVFFSFVLFNLLLNMEEEEAFMWWFWFCWNSEVCTSTLRSSISKIPHRLALWRGWSRGSYKLKIGKVTVFMVESNNMHHFVDYRCIFQATVVQRQNLNTARSPNFRKAPLVKIQFLIYSYSGTYVMANTSDWTILIIDWLLLDSKFGFTFVDSK